LKKEKKISSQIFKLGIINSLVCILCFILLNYFGNFEIDFSYLLISSFASFISGFIVLYYFYYVEVNNKVKALTEKIRLRFLNNEIPQKQNQLEDEDSLELLNQRVNLLIESREKEVKHFENLDSYRKEYLGSADIWRK
jgi:hypothetical protein